MENIKQEIQKHIEAAYGLLPETLIPYPQPISGREFLQHKYDNKEWRQVFYLLKNYSKTNNFPIDLLNHIEIIGELFDLYDSLGMKAALEQLTDEEKHILGECLHAAAVGPFFPDWEFRYLFGVDRDEAIRIADEWPHVKNTDKNVGRVINNSINNLFGYPHHKEKEWVNYISVSPEKAYEIYTKFRDFTGRANTRQTKAEHFHNFE